MDKNTEFSELYRNHYETVCRYINTMIGEGYLAEDVTQETFIELWNKFDEVKEHPNLKGWLLRTASYKMKNLMRKLYRLEKLSYDELLEKPIEEMGYAIKELELVISGSLNPEERKLFKRVFLWGYSVSEIAALYDITQNNARVRISRLTKKINREVSGYDR